MSALLRFAGGLHIVSGRIVVEAELDTGVSGPAAAQGHRRGVRPQHRGARAGARRTAQGSRYIVRVVSRRRGAGPADRADRQPRPAGPRAAAAGGRGSDLRRRGGVAGGVPGARLADRAGPFDRRWRSPARARRRRWRWSAPPGGSDPRQGPRGPRRRPGGGPRRRRDRRAADPAGRPRQRAGLGGAADAPRGAGDRQPAGQLRRRQPAPLGPCRGRRRCPGAAGPGDPR